MDAYKKEKLRMIIEKLHSGVPREAVEDEFQDVITDLSATEIAQLEEQLITEGMKVEEIQSMCDVHAAVFQKMMQEGSAYTDPSSLAKNTLKEFLEENATLKSMIAIFSDEKFLQEPEATQKEKLGHWFAFLDAHYKLKENIIFPVMERYGITAPPQVMWGKDDEVRDFIKDMLKGNAPITKENMESALVGCSEMIVKEEDILLPMISDTFNEKDWAEIAENLKNPDGAIQSEQSVEKTSTETSGKITFATGVLDPQQIAGIFNTLPIDFTFVDKDDNVAYYNDCGHRIFPRPKVSIGRDVRKCHPPKTLDKVNAILENLRSGKSDKEQFWFHKGEQFVFVRYIAVRDENGQYLGCLEATQDISEIHALEGEQKR